MNCNGVLRTVQFVDRPQYRDLVRGLVDGEECGQPYHVLFAVHGHSIVIAVNGLCGKCYGTCRIVVDVHVVLLKVLLEFLEIFLDVLRHLVLVLRSSAEEHSASLFR